jgi:hypothetical protein
MSSPNAPPTPDAARARAARLEARLAVYAQYAAVVAEQAAAVAAGDAARVDALAAERARVAEHFGELRAPAAGPDAGAASFRAALDDALAELAHQGAVDSALGARLAALREAAIRGAGWATPAGATPERPRAALAAPGAPARGDGEAALADAIHPGAAAAGAAAGTPDPIDAVLGGALVAARAAGVGGALGGQFPGRGPRDEAAAAYPASRAGEAGAPDADDAPHVDIRF